jgi:hypothetical protein
MRRRQGFGKATLLALVLGGSLSAATPARADFLGDAGWGALTVLTNVVYMPAKLVYATLGGVTGGLAFGLTGGSFSTAETVWVTSMGGTYVITPRMLQGEDPIAFVGTPTPAETTADSNASPGIQEHELGAPAPGS